MLHFVTIISVSICTKTSTQSHILSLIPNFDFLKKGLRIISPPHFVYELSRKMFLILYSINWRKFMVWFSLLREVLGNMCIVNLCFLCYYVINFKIRLFLYMNKNSRQNCQVSWEQNKLLRSNQGRRENEGGRGSPVPLPFPGAKIFFHVESENIKFITCETLFIE